MEVSVYNYPLPLLCIKFIRSVPKETMSDQKRMNRALTQKYDMHQLRALQKLEQEFMDVICPIYGCDEDTLPVVVDLLKIFNEPASIRQSHLVSPSYAPSFSRPFTLLTSNCPLTLNRLNY